MPAVERGLPGQLKIHEGSRVLLQRVGLRRRRVGALLRRQHELRRRLLLRLRRRPPRQRLSPLRRRRRRRLRGVDGVSVARKVLLLPLLLLLWSLALPLPRLLPRLLLLPAGLVLLPPAHDVAPFELLRRHAAVAGVVPLRVPDVHRSAPGAGVAGQLLKRDPIRARVWSTILRALLIDSSYHYRLLLRFGVESDGLTPQGDVKDVRVRRDIRRLEDLGLQGVVQPRAQRQGAAHVVVQPCDALLDLPANGSSVYGLRHASRRDALLQERVQLRVEVGRKGVCKDVAPVGVGGNGLLGLLLQQLPLLRQLQQGVGRNEPVFEGGDDLLVDVDVLAHAVRVAVPPGLRWGASREAAAHGSDAVDVPSEASVCVVRFQIDEELGRLCLDSGAVTVPPERGDRQAGVVGRGHDGELDTAATTISLETRLDFSTRA